MGADKNSLQRELGLYPEITSKRPPQVLSRSRSNQGAIDPRNNTPTQVLKTRSGKQPEHSKPQGGQTGPEGRLDVLGPKASTGQTRHQHRSDRSKVGHSSNTHRVTRPPHAGSPAFKQRQTGSPVQHTPGHPSKNSQTPTWSRAV